MIRADNFVCIQGWMVTDLKLKGNELLIYAIIYGFSQDGEGEFSGSKSYLAEWTGTSKRTVITVLQSLCEQGLLERRERTVNGVTFCSYAASAETSQGVKKFPQGVKNFHGGSEKISLGGSEKISPNNIGIDKKENIDRDNITPLTPRGDDGFAAFWNAYPKKVGKAAAEKAFRKHRAKLPIMLKALEIHKESRQWQKDGGQFIPNPATWLNQQRWDDEMEQTSTGNIFIDVLKGVGE